MRRLLLVPFFATVLVAQGTPEPVVSIGHTGEPSLTAFAGDYLVTASWSDVALIEIASGLTVAHIPQGSHIVSMEASSDGEILAVGSCDHAVQLWNVRTRTLLRRIPLTQECADALAFSADGKLLATDVYGCCANKKRGLQIWNVSDATLIREITTEATVERIAFSGDGRWIVAVNDKGDASQLEWPSGRELRRFSGLSSPGYTGSMVQASRDGRYFSWVGGGSLRVFDVTTGTEVTLPGSERVEIWDRPPRGPDRRWSEEQVPGAAATFLDDGRLAYISGNRIVLRQLATGADQFSELGWSDNGSWDVLIAPTWQRIRRDGSLIVGGDSSGTRLWDVRAARFRALTSPALIWHNSLRWSRTGFIALPAIGSGVRLWDDRLGRLSRLDRSLDSGENLAFRPDGERMVLDGSSVRVINLASRRVIASRELPLLDADTGLAFSPDGARLAFASGDSFGIFDGNLRPLRHLSSLDVYTTVEHVAFSPDGRWIAAGIGGPNTALRVWSSSGRPDARTLDTQRVTWGDQPPAFSPDSRRLASFVKGRSLTIWSTTSWAVERTWTLAGTGRALAFAPRHSRLAIAAEGDAAIWDPDTGRKLVTLSAPGSLQTKTIAWSPDGQRVVTSADDGILRFWSSTDGRLLASLYVLADTDDWLLMTPDGRLDGSANALATLVAWRTAGRVEMNATLTRSRHTPGLWPLLTSRTLR